MNRNESRRIIMTILYQIFLYQRDKINYDVKDVIDENLEIDNLFVGEMVNGVLDKKDELYKKADQNLKDWKMSRLGLTDQAILCLGLYELLYTDTTDVVAINEAVELTKTYCDEDAKGFVNAVLGKLAKS